MKFKDVKKIIVLLKKYSEEMNIASLEKHPTRDIKTMFTQVDEFLQEWNWSDKDVRIAHGFTHEYYYWNYCLNLSEFQDYKQKAIYINIPYTHIDDDGNYIEVLIFLKKDGTLTICEFDYYYGNSAVTTFISNKKELIEYFDGLVNYYKEKSENNLVAI